MQLPSELQFEIINNLSHHPPSLLSVALVNRLWSTRAIELLWQYPPAKVLAAVQPEAKRQKYANKVRELAIYNIDHHDAFKHLDFASLERVDIYKAPPEGLQLRPYLSPNLRSLRLCCVFRLPRESLDLVQARCPQLRDVWMESPYLMPRNVDIPGFINLLQNSHSLRSIGFGNNADISLIRDVFTKLLDDLPRRLEELTFLFPFHAMLLEREFVSFLQKCKSIRKFTFEAHQPRLTLAEESLALLAGCSTLEHLQLTKILRDNAVKDAIQKFGAQTPFANLRYLSIRGESRTIEPLLSLEMASLTKVDLVVEDRNHSICQILGKLTQLTELCLEFTVDVEWAMSQRNASDRNIDHEIRPEDLKALSSLEKLRGLHIGRTTSNLYASWLTDDKFDDWIKSFPLLRELTLSWQCSLTSSAVIALARSHPFLRRCSLVWNHNLYDWQGFQAPLFPNLEKLTLGLIAPYYESEANILAEMLLKLAPKLQSLEVTYSSGSSHFLVTEFSLLLRQRKRNVSRVPVTEALMGNLNIVD